MAIGHHHHQVSRQPIGRGYPCRRRQYHGTSWERPRKLHGTVPQGIVPQGAVPQGIMHDLHYHEHHRDD